MYEHAFFNNVRDLCIDLQELTENGYSEEPSSTQLTLHTQQRLPHLGPETSNYSSLWTGGCGEL